MNPLMYGNSRISLISKSNIRYEGTLYSVDPKESTVALANVRSFGTEDRESKESFVPASNEQYEIIIFRGSDIKELNVFEAPRPPPVPTDPAILNAGAGPLGQGQPGFGGYGMPPMGVNPYSYYGNWGYPAYNQWGQPTGPNGAPMQQPYAGQPMQTPQQAQQPAAAAAPPGMKPSSPAPTNAPQNNAQAPSPSATTVSPAAPEKSEQEASSPQAQSNDVAPTEESSNTSDTSDASSAPAPRFAPVQHQEQPIAKSFYDAPSVSATEPTPREDNHRPRREDRGKQSWSQKTSGVGNNSHHGNHSNHSHHSAGSSSTAPHGSESPSHSNNTYRGGRGGSAPRGGRGTFSGGAGPRHVQNDFDLERAGASFDKEKEMKEIEDHQQQVIREREKVVKAAVATLATLNPKSVDSDGSGDISELLEAATLEAAYNPSNSIFDTLSCDTFDRLVAQGGYTSDRSARLKSMNDQRKLDSETFGGRGRGAGYRGRGYSGRGRGGGGRGGASGEGYSGPRAEGVSGSGESAHSGEGLPRPRSEGPRDGEGYRGGEGGNRSESTGRGGGRGGDRGYGRGSRGGRGGGMSRGSSRRGGGGSGGESYRGGRPQQQKVFRPVQSGGNKAPAPQQQ